MHKVTQDSIFNEHEKFETSLECPYLIIKLWRAKSIQNKPGIGTFTKKKKKKKSTGDSVFRTGKRPRNFFEIERVWDREKLVNFRKTEWEAREEWFWNKN